MISRELDFPPRYRTTVICLLLAAAILVTFWDVQHYDFVFDDGTYVTKNRNVRAGLTEKSIFWTFTATEGGNWHPVTWLSLLLDHELYGLNSGGYHWTNLLLHIANSILLFLLLNRQTEAVYRSGFVAALFALHPLHIESVAWISERKDVLSTAFWMLTLRFYGDYAKKPDAARYGLVLCFFILGMMSKPMLVTLPALLLVFDYWPLKRTDLSSRKKVVFLIVEKIPLLACSLVISIITFYAQRKAEAVMTFDSIPLGLRTENALVTYVEYMKKMVWPRGLAVYYTYFNAFPPRKVFLSTLLLTAITVFVVLRGRRQPYLAVGWLWYIGTLIPVIGIIQVGSQAMADRYTYVPLIGLFILLVWGIGDLLEHWRSRKIYVAAGTVAVMIVLIVSSRIQLQVWENALTLFDHATRVTPKNYLAHLNVGVALAERLDYENAIFHYKEALKIVPTYVGAHTNLGDALVKLGKRDEAIEHFRAALKSNPNHVSAQRHLADELVKKGNYQEAISLYHQALQLEPDDPELFNNLGVALAQQKDMRLAIKYFESALRINPHYTDARNNLKIVTNNLDAGH